MTRAVAALERLGRVRLSSSFFMRDFLHSGIANFWRSFGVYVKANGYDVDIAQVSMINPPPDKPSLPCSSMLPEARGRCPSSGTVRDCRSTLPVYSKRDAAQDRHRRQQQAGGNGLGE
jgi:hypothetical protein